MSQNPAFEDLGGLGGPKLEVPYIGVIWGLSLGYPKLRGAFFGSLRIRLMASKKF